MKALLEYLADHPELLVPALVLAEITLIGGIALLICRAWRNDAASRYGVALTAMVLIWLTLPATLLLRARGYETLSWKQKLYTEPIPLSVLENLPPPEPEKPTPPSPFVLLWAAGTAVVLVRFGVGLLKVGRLKRAAEPLPHLTGAAPVYVTEQVAGPVVVGALRPSVLIPSSIVDGLSETELHDVLAHEFAHVARRHLLVAVLQRLTVALFWPHPVVHLLSRQMMEAREEVCDNVVLGTAGRARYARVLLRVAECRQSSGHFSASLGLFSLESNLEERVKSLLDPHRRISTEMNYRRITFASIVLLSGVTALAGARVQTELVAIAVPAYDGLQAPEKAPVTTKKKTKHSTKSSRQSALRARKEAERAALVARDRKVQAEELRIRLLEDKKGQEKAIQDQIDQIKRVKDLGEKDKAQAELESAQELKEIEAQRANLAKEVANAKLGPGDREKQLAEIAQQRATIEKTLNEEQRNMETEKAKYLQDVALKQARLDQQRAEKERALAALRTKLNIDRTIKVRTNSDVRLRLDAVLDAQKAQNLRLDAQRGKLDRIARLNQSKDDVLAAQRAVKLRLDAQRGKLDRVIQLDGSKGNNAQIDELMRRIKAINDQNSDMKAKLDALQKEIERLREQLRKQKGGDSRLHALNKASAADRLFVKDERALPLLSDLPIMGRLFTVSRQKKCLPPTDRSTPPSSDPLTQGRITS